MSIMFITHDLGVVAELADRVAVMYGGLIMEEADIFDIFKDPKHPYTLGLLASIPDMNQDKSKKLQPIPGSPPDMIHPPKGDAFAPRNPYALNIDFEEEPPVFRLSETHYAATWLLHPKAAKVDMPESLARRIQRMKEAGGRA